MAVLDHGEATTAAMRQAAYNGAAEDAEVARYVVAVRDHAYRITDVDLSGLRDQGLSDDAIFELTVAAALGAAQRCLDAGLAVLDPARGL
jgi:alkylhydroperoxidase family enzyme